MDKKFGRKELEQIIKDQFNIDAITPLINTQISKYITERGYTYKEIAQALVFYMEIKKGNYDSKYGIGNVHYFMEEAQRFFKRKREEKERQLKSLENSKNIPNIILKPKELKKRRKIQFINNDESEE